MPLTRTCPLSGQNFIITDEDLAFYEKMGVPPPTLCPEERRRRRIHYRNHSSLFHRTCEGTGKKTISIYHPEGGYKVLDNDYWWSDAWKAQDYGRDFDFSRDFFPQYSELLKSVPHMARIQQGEMINSRYTNCVSNNKNCYLIFSSNGNEDCMYGTNVDKSRDCYENYDINGCELAYECLNCVSSYEITFSQQLKNCINTHYCFDCTGCRNCFACIGLRQAEFHILNKKVTQEEFENFMKSEERKKEALLPLRELLENTPIRYANFFRCENCTGDHLFGGKNCEECFECHDLEDSKFCNSLRGAKDCYDISYFGATGNNELCYECEAIGHGAYNLKFCKLCWGGCENLQYCYECFNCQDCFGCVGLQKARFHIFNKAYSEEAYKIMIKKIIQKMEKTGEYGQFFPCSICPFSYNESIVQDYFPLTKETAEQKGFHWREEISETQYSGSHYKIPKTIKEVSDEVLDQILVCKATGKYYRIMKSELDFYRKMNLPLSPFCPKERHRRRLELRNPWHLFTRSCAHCQKSIQTTYAPDRPEKVLCEECYLKAL